MAYCKSDLIRALVKELDWSDPVGEFLYDREFCISTISDGMDGTYYCIKVYSSSSDEVKIKVRFLLEQYDRRGSRDKILMDYEKEWTKSIFKEKTLSSIIFGHLDTLKEMAQGDYEDCIMKHFNLDRDLFVNGELLR